MKTSPMLWTMMMIIGGAGLGGFAFIGALDWIYRTFGAEAPRVFMIGMFAVTLTVGVFGRLLQGRRR